MTNKKTPTSTSRRAALRAQQEAQESAKKRRRIIGVIVGVVVVAAIILAVVLGINHKSDSSASSTQITPPSATKTGVYTLNPDKVKKGAPTVTVYQDYQCPACKGAEDLLGKPLNDLSSKGEIKLQYHTLTFLDRNLRNDSSSRAAMAAAAADVVGKYEAYHDVVYSHQPKQEGAGYTDEQLRKEFASEAGITGANLTRFQHIYDTRQTEQFVNEANDKGLHKMQDLNAPSTPAFAVNDKLWEGWKQLGSNTTPDELLKAIDAAK
ncbi:thioredoxin domain-containing protein [Cutibacterium avidum]|uniref:DsbA family protein n=1 Tax=Cutibacterium avidum TaxID=33010 RepID=UPI00192BBBDC|nr:thioredoxin domain-containing protein [Cutibacterium avidum]QQY15020.1 thioredoxin domain-containing protein [Cutibacterium avidum]